MLIVADKNIPCVKSAFSKIGDVQTLETERITRTAVKDADLLLIRSEIEVNKALLEGSNVRFVGSATSGINHVDLNYLQDKEIGFANAAGGNANSVAEYVVAALLFLSGKKGMRLQDKTLGVVGVGNIGSKVVKMAEALGMTVLQNDPPKARATGNSSFLSLEDLMDADIFTLHVPLTKTGEDATYHLFDEKQFAKLKRGCVFINTSRGGVVETDAIKSALNQKRLGAVVLDVWEGEPDIDLELLTLVDIATPHIAGYSLDGKIKSTEMIFRASCQYFGFSPKWDPTSELSAHKSNLIRVAEVSEHFESRLNSIIKSFYDIERDDRDLRKLLVLSKKQRGKYFGQLRKSYRVRREFSNAKIVLSSNDHSFCNTLSQLGFSVESLEQDK